MTRNTGVVDSSGNPYRDQGYKDGTGLYGSDHDLLLSIALGSSLVAQSYPAELITTSYTLVNQELLLVGIWIPNPQTISGVWWFQQTAGVYTANNNSRVGLMTSNGTQAVPQVNCADSTTLWKASTGQYAFKAFTSSYVSPGQEYVWIQALWNRSAQTTAPVLGGRTANTGASQQLTNSNISLAVKLSTQTNILTANTNWSSFTNNTGVIPWFGLF